jgi:hypothetical protein
MSTRFAQRRRKQSKPEAKATVSKPATVTTAITPAGGNLEEFLFKAYGFVADNDRVRGYVLWIWSDGKRVYAVTNDRYLSNALYHALRALGRNRVRRWSEGGKWIIAYS